MALFALIILEIVFAFLFGAVIKPLWNDCLVNNITGFHPINYTEAVEIYVLFTILFKNKR